MSLIDNLRGSNALDYLAGASFFTSMASGWIMGGAKMAMGKTPGIVSGLPGMGTVGKVAYQVLSADSPNAANRAGANGYISIVKSFGGNSLGGMMTSVLNLGGGGGSSSGGGSWSGGGGGSSGGGGGGGSSSGGGGGGSSSEGGGAAGGDPQDPHKKKHHEA